VPGLILASVPMNSEAGAYMTFGGPVVLFAVVAATLYVLFTRPHRRVPPRRALASSHAAAAGSAVRQGPTAPGGGPAESTAEPHGANRDALAADDGGTGKVAGTTEGSTEPGTTESTEASE
jgi:hypothetical protein